VLNVHACTPFACRWRIKAAAAALDQKPVAYNTVCLRTTMATTPKNNICTGENRSTKCACDVEERIKVIIILYRRYIWNIIVRVLGTAKKI